MEVIIRSATHKDITAIDELYATDERYVKFNKKHVPSKNLIKATIDSETAVLLVLEEKQPDESLQIVGSVSMSEILEPLSDCREGYITALIVLPSRRRFGYGRILFEELEKIAQKRGYPRTIFTSGTWRKEAQKFHIALGYKIRAHALEEGDTNFFEKKL